MSSGRKSSTPARYRPHNDSDVEKQSFPEPRLCGVRLRIDHLHLQVFSSAPLIQFGRNSYVCQFHDLRVAAMTPGWRYLPVPPLWLCCPLGRVAAGSSTVGSAASSSTFTAEILNLFEAVDKLIETVSPLGHRLFWTHQLEEPRAFGALHDSTQQTVSRARWSG